MLYSAFVAEIFECFEKMKIYCGCGVEGVEGSIKIACLSFSGLSYSFLG
jgi:hypothetical protein